MTHGIQRPYCEDGIPIVDEIGLLRHADCLEGAKAANITIGPESSLGSAEGILSSVLYHDPGPHHATMSVNGRPVPLGPIRPPWGMAVAMGPTARGTR